MHPARGAKAPVLLLVCVLSGYVLSGCSGGDSDSSAPVGHVNRLLSSASPTDARTASFLHTGQAEVDYLQWQADASGTLQGTELDATVTGRSPDARVSVQQFSFSGRLSGDAITLTATGGSTHGTLTDVTLTLSTIAEDGSIQPETFRRASDADYNAALGGLRAAVQKANDQQNRANAQSSAEQTLARDYQSLDDAKTTLGNDVAGMSADVTGMETDEAGTRTDELTVLSEAKSPDTTGVCGDAAGVGGDAAGVSGDASGIAADVDGVATDLATLHDRASTVAADLRALLAIEPAYDGGTGPSPHDVRHALAAAAQAAANNVAALNGYVDRANTAVATAYGYAATASRAGGCGSTDSPPPPLGHLASPFDGQGAIAA